MKVLMILSSLQDSSQRSMRDIMLRKRMTLFPFHLPKENLRFARKSWPLSGNSSNCRSSSFNSKKSDSLPNRERDR